MTKPGYKTTEFWLSMAAVLCGALMASGIFEGLGQDHWAVKVVGLATTVLGALGYTAARGIVKANGSKQKALAEIAARAVKNAEDPR